MNVIVHVCQAGPHKNRVHSHVDLCVEKNGFSAKQFCFYLNYQARSSVVKACEKDVCLLSIIWLKIFLLVAARKSQHRFPTPSDEEKVLIYNYIPVFKGVDSIFIQNYYF